jgi:hypothetical protein
MSLLIVLLLAVALTGPAWAQGPDPPTGGRIDSGTRFVLTVAKAGTGVGTVTGAGITCGLDCTETISNGIQIALFVSAGANSVFTGWSGACSGSASPCVVTMSQAQLVTATFNMLGWTLAWNDNSFNETDFELQRRTPCSSGTYATLAFPAANQTQYTDSAITPGTHYEYRIRAENAVGPSAFSNEVCTP